MKFKMTFWKGVFVALILIGVYGTYLRFFKGLGAVTNLSDQFPWGIWIGFDVLCGVMLAAGGFTLTAAVHIFNIKRLRPIVRPTILTAFLGYVLVCVALVYDLGRFYNVWHPLIMYNPHSVMFEVGWCVMCYTTVLALEFSFVVLEKFKLTRLMKVMHGLLPALVVAGVLLSTLHQSSLGTMYLIMPNKLYPFWYSPLLPAFFFISSIAVGLAMMIFESSLSAKYFHKQLELPVLQELGCALIVVLLFYAVLKFEDLFHRGVLRLLLVNSYERNFFLLEIALSVVIPLALLLQKRIRNSASGLYLSSVLVLLGFVTNRLNVSVTGMETALGTHYVPKWTEFGVTAAIIAAGFCIFTLAVKYLPIFEPEVELEVAHRAKASAPAPMALAAAAMENADD